MKITQHILKSTVSLIVISLFASFLNSQENIKSINVKEGEVLDLLLLNQNPDTDEDLQEYFTVASPVATKLSYQPLPGIKVKEHTQGNFKPDIIAFGKWDDMSDREKFINTITDFVPDFHERRRRIWSYFGLVYFKMNSDVTLNIDSNKFNVVTSVWVNEKSNTHKTYENYIQKLKTHNASVLVKLQDGHSPFGYTYNPDFIIITEWVNEEEYQKFIANNHPNEINTIRQLNDIVLE